MYSEKSQAGRSPVLDGAQLEVLRSRKSQPPCLADSLQRRNSPRTAPAPDEGECGAWR